MPDVEPRDRTSPQEQDRHILRLPTEIQIEILSHLDACDQVSAVQTCTLWHTLLLTEKLLLESRYRLHLYRDVREAEGIAVHRLLKARDGVKLHCTVLDGVIQRFFFVTATDTDITTEGPDITDSPLLDEAIGSPYPVVVAFAPKTQDDHLWVSDMMKHVRVCPQGGIIIHFREPDRPKVQTNTRWALFGYGGWKTATIRQLAEAIVRFLEKEESHGGGTMREFGGTVVRGPPWRVQLGIEALAESNGACDGHFRLNAVRLLQRDLEEGWRRDI
ncbi:hypothetical protein TWF696_001809 [Orbilia brochopaga]|uniref:F-box domain-containing protein n=1 Tax=Orbilia brochopaga TaxID=3140254 RepID=A0AAV9U6I9_9PEZI